MQPDLSGTSHSPPAAPSPQGEIHWIFIYQLECLIIDGRSGSENDGELHEAETFGLHICSLDEPHIGDDVGNDYPPSIDDITKCVVLQFSC